MRAGPLSDIHFRARRPDSRRRFPMRPGAPGSALGADGTSKRPNGVAAGLVLIESEGAVFNSIAPRVEAAYIPAFYPHFAHTASPELCAEVWRRVAIYSRLRGANLFRTLATVLRLLNRRGPPSIRRAAVANTLETWLAELGDESWRGDVGFRSDPVLKPAWDWYREVERLVGVLPAPLVFSEVSDTLPIIARGSTIVAMSQEPEAEALRRWNSSGLMASVTRVAGRERGNTTVYLMKACSGGFGSVPITVIGSSHATLAAARAVEARFLPVLPGKENESWRSIRSIFENTRESFAPDDGDDRILALAATLSGEPGKDSRASHRAGFAHASPHDGSNEYEEAAASLDGASNLLSQFMQSCSSNIPR